MFKLLRVHQYIKNILVFAPLLFSFNYSSSAYAETFVVFILFSAISSCVYIINDLFDIKEDKKHPKKKNRPLASGKVKPHHAMTLMLSLAFFSLSFAYLFSKTVLIVLLIYLLINIAYSYRLKHIPILDIMIIAFGFVLRLYAGSIAVDISLSMWIITITFLLAIFLALAKRRDDVVLNNRGASVRKNIDGYNIVFVDNAMITMASVVILSYLLYTVSDSVINKFGTENLYLTTFFVVMGILRYMQITFVNESSGNPTLVFLKDKFLQLVIAGWILSLITIIKIL